MTSAVTFGLVKAMTTNHAADIQSLENKIAALEERIAQLTLINAVEQANVAGLTAQLELMFAENPGSRMLMPMSATFEDGSQKNLAALIFETSFDSKATSLGIPNPARFRRR